VGAFPELGGGAREGCYALGVGEGLVDL